MALRAGTKIRTLRVLICSSGTPVKVVMSLAKWGRQRRTGKLWVHKANLFIKTQALMCGLPKIRFTFMLSLKENHKKLCCSPKGHKSPNTSFLNADAYLSRQANFSHSQNASRQSTWSSPQVRNMGFQVWRWKELCKLEVNSTLNLKCSLWAGESFRASVGLSLLDWIFPLARYDSRVVPNVFKLSCSNPSIQGLERKKTIFQTVHKKRITEKYCKNT